MGARSQGQSAAGPDDNQKRNVMPMTRMLAAASIRISDLSKVLRTRNMGTSLCPGTLLKSYSNEAGDYLIQIK
jgi:hypothetical protein